MTVLLLRVGYIKMLRSTFCVLRKRTATGVQNKASQLASFSTCTSQSTSVQQSSEGVAAPPLKGAAGWQVWAAVCVTRHPLLCPPLDPMQLEYSKHIEQLDIEDSLQSDFELQIIEDEARKVLRDTDMAIEDEGEHYRAALESLDSWKKEEQNFADNVMPKEGSLPLGSFGSDPCRQAVLVQRGGEGRWGVPQGKWRPHETLRQTCERILAESCDASLGARVIGNSPIGFHQYKFPDTKDGYVGAKVFLYRAAVSTKARHAPLTQLEKCAENQKWISQSALADHLDAKYAKSVHQSLISDS